MQNPSFCWRILSVIQLKKAIGNDKKWLAAFVNEFLQYVGSHWVFAWVFVMHLWDYSKQKIQYCFRQYNVVGCPTKRPHATVWGNKLPKYLSEVARTALIPPGRYDKVPNRLEIGMGSLLRWPCSYLRDFLSVIGCITMSITVQAYNAW